VKEFDASAYNIMIVRQYIDDHPYFIGSVREFPHIKVYEDSWPDSYEAIKAILEDLYAESLDLGEPFPAPIVDGSCSGRVTTRLPKWLHQRLDSQAKVENVSLNTHIVSLLSFALTNYALSNSVSSNTSIGPALLDSNSTDKAITASLKVVSINSPVVRDKRVVKQHWSIPVIKIGLQGIGEFGERQKAAGYSIGDVSSMDLMHQTKTETYSQELPHGQEIRH
jgi:hypothetical protein